MKTLVRDKIKEFKDTLTELVYLIKKKRKLKDYDMIVPILLIAGSGIKKAIEYIYFLKDYRYGTNDTIYTHFINLDKSVQNNIINDLIKDIDETNITKTIYTKEKTIKIIADEYHITDDAISNILEKKYLVFFVSFILLLYKAVIYNTFSNKELETGFEKDVFLKHRVSKIEDDLEDFKKIVEDY